MRTALVCCVVLTSVLLSGCGALSEPPVTNQPTGVSQAPPTSSHDKLTAQPPRHIVIVIEENHAYSEIVGNSHAPYINSLMQQGASYTNYHGVEHPSQPNYLDLFSGSNQGVTSDSCPHTFTTPNLATELVAAHLTFDGYSESLPSAGYTGCTNGFLGLPIADTYARKHSPWVNFSNVPQTDNLPFTSFPKDYAKLPTVSFVIPNLKHDMHSGTVEAADAWLKQNIGPYARWAKTHDSLLIVTWDEDDNTAKNQIPTFMVGATIRPGRYGERLNHFNLLRTIEGLYGLPYLGQSANVKPIRGVWTANG